MRSASLDGLRGAAALTVLYSHIFLLFAFPVPMGWSGQTAVQVFFALSGFLMGRQYLGIPCSYANLASYARRRVGRVFPLYLTVVAVSYAATSMGYPYLYQVDSTNIWQHLLFIQGTLVLYTVPLEVQFYVFFPMLWFAFSRHRVLGGLLLAALIPATLFGLSWVPNSFFYSYFMAGVATSLVPVRQLPGWAFLLALCGVGLALPGVTTPSASPFPAIWTSPFNLAAICYLLYATQSSTLADTILGNRAMRLLGRISYPLYLLHGPVILALIVYTDLEKGSLLVFSGAVTALSLLAAALVHVVFEEPLRQLISNGPRGEPRPMPGPCCRGDGRANVPAIGGNSDGGRQRVPRLATAAVPLPFDASPPLAKAVQVARDTRQG